MRTVSPGLTWNCSRVAGAIAAALVAAVAPIASVARDGPAPFTVIETGKSYARLQSAVDANMKANPPTLPIAPRRIARDRRAR